MTRLRVSDKVGGELRKRSQWRRRGGDGAACGFPSLQHFSRSVEFEPCGTVIFWPACPGSSPFPFIMLCERGSTAMDGWHAPDQGANWVESVSLTWQIGDHKTNNLQSVKVDRPTGKVSLKFWQEACPVGCLQHVKKLVIHGFQGNKSEHAFIKFIAERAHALKMMVIFCALNLSLLQIVSIPRWGLFSLSNVRVKTSRWSGSNFEPLLLPGVSAWQLMFHVNPFDHANAVVWASSYLCEPNQLVMYVCMIASV